MLTPAPIRRTLTAGAILLAGVCALAHGQTFSDPVHYWQFESGATTVDSAGSATLTHTGSPTTATGKIGGGMAYNGSTQWSTATALSALHNETTWSLALWVKSSATISANRFAAILTGGSGITGICPHDNTGAGVGPLLWHNSAAVLDLNGGAPTADGQWHHVCVTFDAGLATVYLDGVSVGTDTGNGALSASLSAFDIGGRAANAGQRLDCTIDEVRLYTRALSGGDVAALHAYTGATVYPQVIISQLAPQRAWDRFLSHAPFAIIAR